MEKLGYSTVDEVISDILQLLSPEYQEKVKEMSIKDFYVEQHFNFRQWISDKYFYQNPSQEQLIKSLSIFEECMVLDGETFSHMILEKLYEKIITEKR
jgi:hypothetical protein